MKVYHQTGHNYKWNIESFVEDNVGDGLIFSPMNISYSNLEKLSREVKNVSFFDPQLYLPKDAKGKLNTYKFFPTNLVDGFKTPDFNSTKTEIAKECISFQTDNDFKYIVIPARYFEVIPSDYYDQFFNYIIEPFLTIVSKKNIEKEILLTLIVKQSYLMNDNNLKELLNWVTALPEIDGVYLIFENDIQSKLIKNAGYLFSILKFIHILKSNELSVHIGYCNLEGIIFSIANPDSISMGSYENLRKFRINRFESKVNKPWPPNPRLYSSLLLQMIDYGYLDGIKTLSPEWNKVFEDSKYHPIMFQPDYNWHFQKPETYKHFFLTYYKQILKFPSGQFEKIEYLKSSLNKAIEIFLQFKENGIILDDNSDGSHLPFWLTSVNMFNKYIME